jgi:hypothetical protein
MAMYNLIDDSVLTTIGAATPGYSVPLLYRTSLSRAAMGVPTRVWVCAASTVANDTGSVQLLDSGGGVLMTILVTGSTERWYVQDGYLPATDQMIYPYYGGNTLGTLTVYAVCPLRYVDIGPTQGALNQSIGDITIAAAGTVV